MISAEVAAAQAKPDGGRLPTSAKSSSDVPWRRGQKLRGYYYCLQGRTNLTVEIGDVTGDEFDAVAEFTFTGGSHHAPAHGSWRMRGSYEPGKRTAKLEADGWIEQPENYALADFTGKVEPDGSLRGTVDGEGCSSFVLSIDKTPERR